MKSRLLNRKIEFWQTTNAADGYGGNTTNQQRIASSWCQIKTASTNSRYVSRLTNLGITDPTAAIIIKLRRRNDITYNSINQYILYKNVKYIIQNAPADIDNMGLFVEIIAVRESTKSVDNIIPVGQNVFDDTFDDTFN